MIRVKHKNTGKVLLRLRARSLAGVNLSRMALRGAALPGADLRGANLRGADLRQATWISPGRQLGIDIAWTALAWLVLAVIFTWVIAVLQWAVWEYCPPLHWMVPLLHPIAWFFSVTFGCLARIVMILDRWRCAMWAAPDLRSANLQGADLRGALLTGAKWEGARYDEATRWPGGFDPTRHGVVTELTTE